MNLKQIKEEAVLLFDKPYRWTSFDVVNKVKYASRAKVGHCGTLDPLASGLLILVTGKATKMVSSIQDAEKEYTGAISLGETTASFDMENPVDQIYPTDHITDELIRETAKTFVGIKEQMPPIFSAKKQGGKRYYDMAREGEEFVPVANVVDLKEFDVTDIVMPIVHFRIVCGKGFYVRSLARDFGKALNSGAHLSALRRTRIGDYKVEDAWKIDEFVKTLKAEKDWQ
ncbi:MAG TPA: tRNA pseudouridine(55) synthase TruB [Chitinophagales bacterium]|nr:tRNA pseudouridine(55) synthase TruB [Chitinophagales bacterium]